MVHMVTSHNPVESHLDYLTVSESKHRESKLLDRVRSDSGVKPKQSSNIFNVTDVRYPVTQGISLTRRNRYASIGPPPSRSFHSNINIDAASTWRRASANYWGVSQGLPSFILSCGGIKYSTTASENS